MVLYCRSDIEVWCKKNNLKPWSSETSICFRRKEILRKACDISIRIISYRRFHCNSENLGSQKNLWSEVGCYVLAENPLAGWEPRFWVEKLTPESYCENGMQYWSVSLLKTPKKKKQTVHIQYTYNFTLTSRIDTKRLTL